MYQGQFQGQNQGQHTQRRRRRRRRSNKVFMMLVSLLLLATMMVGGTLAYLFTKTDPVNNHFTPSYVDCTVTESFNGTTKTDVNVRNDGDINAYIRVKLVTYRVNNQGQHIGGLAQIPSFTPGTGWVAYGGYYYYTQPVAPNAQPANSLIDSIELTSQYYDSDGGKQVIEVMAEAIQSVPAEAVGNSWHVSITPGSVTAYTNG